MLIDNKISLDLNNVRKGEIFLLILPEAIIEAFEALGGKRYIKEIKDWIYERYGERWKDIGTSMADMVPVSHGGSDSSQIHDQYRVLYKVSRGKYCLIKNREY